MSGSNFDPLGDAIKYGNMAKASLDWGAQIGRNWAAKRARREAEAEFGPEVGQVVEIAVRNGQPIGPILERARKDRAAEQEREELLRNPPPIHGSAEWASPDSLAAFLKSRDELDTPGTVLFGVYRPDELTEPSFVHWNGDGHLLTVAPTRSGKAQTVIIPNLLRYRGSCVVLDPKGELYKATSAWRAANVGPVYRWAPFDDGSSGLPCHGFNPLLGFRSEADADNLASVLFPKDPRSPEFFADDAIACMKALMLWVLKSPAPERRNLVSVFKMACLPTAEFKALMERGLARSDDPVLVATAHNILGKSGDRGLPNLRDSLFAKISKWLVPTLLDSLRADDFRFAALKDQPATVYLEVPFDKMETYAPVLRLMLQSALDGMLHNPVVPKIPVLFVLDEFLQLGPYPQFRNAIRTHAGAGVRLWFFLQDLAGIEEHYPNGWKPFFNCAVQQFFGVNDPSTARMISEDILGMRTVAYRSTNASGNISGSSGQWKDPGNSGVNMSTGESIQFAARPLMTHDEIMALLSGWADENEGRRLGIVKIAAAPRPFQVHLSVYGRSKTLKEREGTWLPATAQQEGSNAVP